MACITVANGSSRSFNQFKLYEVFADLKRPQQRQEMSSEIYQHPLIMSTDPTTFVAVIGRIYRFGLAHSQNASRRILICQESPRRKKFTTQDRVDQRILFGFRACYSKDLNDS